MRLAKRRVADRARNAANSDERRAAESSEQRETRLASHSTIIDTVGIYDVSPLLINSCIIHYHV